MHGWLTFLAGVLTVIGALLLYAAFSGQTYGGFDPQTMAATAIVLFVLAAIVALLIYMALRAQYLHVKTGKEALIGAVGLATTDLKPKGQVRVQGEFWQAKSFGQVPIANGESVEVVTMDGMFLIVKRTKEKLNFPTSA